MCSVKYRKIQVGMTYHSESLSDDRVHDGQLLEVLVLVVSESTVRVTELLFLLLVKSLSTFSSVMLRQSKLSGKRTQRPVGQQDGEESKKK